MKITALLFATASLLFTTSAMAFPTLDASSVNSLNNDLVKSVVETVGIGADHRAYQPAAALGAVIGLDVGIDLGVVVTPAKFKEAMSATGSGQAPDYLGLPKLNIHKGLPYGVDLGFTFFGYSGYRLMGFDVKWAPLPGTAATPALAVRASYNGNKLFWVDTTTWKVDVLVSKNLVVIEPYAGLGMQFVSGDVLIPAGQSLPIGVSGNYSTNVGHIFFGLPIKLGLIHITAEYDRSFAGLNNYGAKFSLSL